MDVAGKVPETINCHACGAAIDLTGQTAFTHIDCPHCNALSVVPLQFGNFLLLNSLGVGGMGTVYKALDLSLNRFLALKILRRKLAAKPEFIENFSREARAAAAVNHPNIAQVYSFGEHQGQYYLAMELLERGSLDDRMATLGKLAEKDVLEIGVQVAAGLRAAQQRGLLHRDVKPGNILFNDDGVPKIVDFGLARAQQAGAPVGPAGSEPIWGTPYYIAPEKLRGQPEDWRSDMYSLGASLFHALAGRPPFDAATASEVVTKHATQPAFSLRTYAPAVHNYTAHVIARMLSKNPAERYETYDGLIHDLNEALSIIKSEASAKAVVAPSGERVPVGTIVGTVVALLACAAVVWFVWNNRVGLFHLEAAAAPAPPGAVVTPPPTANNPPAANAEINFQENAAWVKAWNLGMQQLAQGEYTPALLAYESTLTLLGPARPKQRQWVYYFEGLALQANGRPSESLSVFVKAIAPGTRPRVPETVTTGNFADALVYAMVGELPIAELEQAAPRLPPWAAALTALSAGFKHLEAGELEPAARWFRQYQHLPPQEPQRWAYSLQPLADKLAAQCETATRVLLEVAALEKQQQYAKALDLLHATEAKTIDTIKAVLEQREPPLAQAVDKQRQQDEAVRQEAERQRQQQAELERQHAAEEAKLVQAVDPEVAPLYQKYEFKPALAKYEAFLATLKTAAGRQSVQSRLTTARLLTEFKSQLAADFARQPYDRGDLRTRADVELTEKLVQASDSELVFAAKYGQIAIPWTELAPAELVKLAAFYATAFAQADRPDTLAHRYLMLAVFCHQYGPERAVSAYAQQATQLQPDLHAEVEMLLGKTAP